VDLDRPNTARIHDYLLGGSHHLPADRAVAERMRVDSPGTVRIVEENRAFLGRVVRYLMGEGVRQFVDLGSGLPTAGSAHEVAQAAEPNARVVYVDSDPQIVAQSNEIISGTSGVTAVLADLRDPAQVLVSRPLRALVDMREPVGFLFVGVLHAVPDAEHPDDIIAGYAAASTPGSHVVVSHASGSDHGDPAAVARDRAAITALLDELELVEPGVVPITQWRPSTTASPASADPHVGRAVVPCLAAVGLKP
jgi:hypothetical protein